MHTDKFEERIFQKAAGSRGKIHKTWLAALRCLGNRPPQPMPPSCPNPCRIRVSFAADLHFAILGFFLGLVLRGWFPPPHPWLVLLRRCWLLGPRWIARSPRGRAAGRSSCRR